MWVKIDDKLPRHPKILAAGRILGANGAGLALAVYVAADCYCAEHLTDGRLAPEVIDGLTCLVRKPKTIAAALVTVNLFEVDGAGYRIHDYHDYNPTAQVVKDKRARDRTRKGGTGPDSTANPSGFQDDSTRIPERSRGGAGARPQDGTGSTSGSGSSEEEREKEPTTPRGPLMGSHARCASHCAGFCVPFRLHEQLLAKCRGMSDADAGRAVDAFYRAVEADPRWQGTIPEADAFKFLQARWTEHHGGAPQKTAKELRADAVRRELLGESA